MIREEPGGRANQGTRYYTVGFHWTNVAQAPSEVGGASFPLQVVVTAARAIQFSAGSGGERTFKSRP